MNFADAPNLGAGHTFIYNPPMVGNPPGYGVAQQQYATLFHNDPAMQPGAIFYARNEEDVQTVLKYAAKKKVKVAVRTGGHQYSGASTTNKHNILLDLSRCKVDGHRTVVDDTDPSTITVRMGINQNLRRLNEWLRDAHGAFIPHGHCAHVHLGGHVQTGGYGHAVRAFGLLADHVVGMRVYTADGVCHDLVRGVQDDAEMFYAMLGGSPGNFGVLVRVDVRALRAKAYPNARGMTLLGLYEPKTMKKLLKLMARWSDDDNLPAGFDYTISVIGAGRRDVLPPEGSAVAAAGGFPFPQEAMDFATENPPSEDALTIFQKLGLSDAEVENIMTSASTIDWASLIRGPLAFTIVWVQWANLGGPKEVFPADMQQRFQDIKDCQTDYGKWLNADTQDWDAGQPQQDLAWMSTKAWAFDIKREFHLPFHKRSHVTARSDLSTSGWGDFLVGRLSEGIRVDKWLAGLRISMQTQLFAGKHSRFTTGDPDNQACHPWRRKMRGLLLIDGFYAQNLGNVGRHTARDWVDQNTAGLLGANGCYSNEDLRLLSFSFENAAPERDLNANNVWPLYYDSVDTVQRLRRTKAEVDPTGMLTPNEFSIRP